MSAGASLLGRVRAAARDPLLVNSWLILTTTALMAGAGAVFWVIAARLQSAEAVGLAGSLVATGEALAVFAQLGLNIALIKTMPSSERKAADATSAAAFVAVAGLLLALAYAAALPLISPELGEVVTFPWTAVLFAVLVSATAVNQLTDGLFLAINRVASNLRINGLLMGVVKCGLPLALAGAGAVGLYGSVGLASMVAAIISLWVILRHLPGRRSLKPSDELWHSRRFVGAGYATNVLYLLPQLVFPVIVINARGPAESAVYFIGFQIVTLLNAGVYAISNSMYAEASRAPHRATAIVRTAGLTIAWSTVVGVLVLVAASPLVLRIFGPDYTAGGTTTLRVLALGTIGVAFNYWCAMRLRIASHPRAMVSVQLTTTALMIGAAWGVADLGTAWVAGAWGVGQLCGGVLGYLVSRTLAPICDTDVGVLPDSVSEAQSDEVLR